MRVVILQSYREEGVAEWMQRCLASVVGWAAHQGYEYRFLGDTLFGLLPAWYLDKVGERLPMATDLARLLWLQQVLREDNVDVAVWLDADTLVFAPDAWRVQLDQDCVFGCERWLQKAAKGNGYKIYRNVHNAYCGFQKRSVTLPFLIDRVQHLVRQVDTSRVPLQFVGPKLLTSLHNTVQFALDPRAGAISPLLRAAVLTPGHEKVLASYRRDAAVPLCAANLCASLVQDAEMDGQMDAQMDVQMDRPMDALVDALLDYSQGL
ncbi:MAG: hypothetical protein AAF993_08445 [Pseudomonadota bacterium]